MISSGSLVLIGCAISFIIGALAVGIADRTGFWVKLSGYGKTPLATAKGPTLDDVQLDQLSAAVADDALEAALSTTSAADKEAALSPGALSAADKAPPEKTEETRIVSGAPHGQAPKETRPPRVFRRLSEEHEVYEAQLKFLEEQGDTFAPLPAASSEPSPSPDSPPPPPPPGSPPTPAPAPALVSPPDLKD